RVHHDRRLATAGKDAVRRAIHGDPRRTVTCRDRPVGYDLPRFRVDDVDRILVLVIDKDPALAVADASLGPVAAQLDARDHVAVLRFHDDGGPGGLTVLY